MSNLYNFWYKLTASRSTDADEARREYIAKVVLVIVGAVTLVATLLTVAGVSVGAFAPDFLLELI